MNLEGSEDEQFMARRLPWTDWNDSGVCHFIENPLKINTIYGGMLVCDLVFVGKMY
jgi:hypothetical protein